MNNIVTFSHTPTNDLPRIRHSGLIPVLLYDPFAPRCFQGIKAHLADGHPAIVRLHAAAEYPTHGEVKYQIDQEAHAVLIVGYDDDRRAFLIIDPFKRTGGSNLEPRWLGYSDLEILMVDSSLGSETRVEGLGIKVTMLEDGDKLEVALSLPHVHGNIMDHDVITLEDIDLSCRLRWSGGETTLTAVVPGTFLIGETARVELDLPPMSGPAVDVHIAVAAILHGRRPYVYADPIGVDYTLAMQLAQNGNRRYSASA